MNDRLHHTEEIINMLESIDSMNHAMDHAKGHAKDHAMGHTKGHAMDHAMDHTIDDTQNNLVCRLVNFHLREFFDDISIDHDTFKQNKWDINKVLYDNDTALFYNHKYVTDQDEIRFFEVFDKYVACIEETLSKDNHLFSYMKAWSSTKSCPWLKKMLVSRKYQIISPTYTTNLYVELSDKYEDPEKMRIEFQKNLDIIIEKTRDELKDFKKKYHEILQSYIYEFPLKGMDQTYVSGFINGIIMEIIDLTEKLLNLNIYAIHPLVNNIIDVYVPLDYINSYNPKEHGNKSLCIV